MSRFDKTEAIAPWAVGLLLACPVLVAFYPPMTDLPYHEAAIAILRYFDDTTKFPPGLYQHNIGQPNQLFHLVGWALSYVVSTRWAVKLVVAAAVVAVPVCTARFARHVGASPWVALAVAPMALGWYFFWGLVANLLGLAALLAVLPALDRYAQRPSAARFAGTVGAIVLLYFAHEAMLFAYAGAVLLLAVVYAESWKKAAWHVAPFAVCLAATAAQHEWQKRLMTPAVQAVPVEWHSLLHKTIRVPYLIVPTTDDVAQLSVSAICVLAVVTCFWARARERRDATGHERAVAPAGGQRFARVRAWARTHRWELFALGGFGAYLAFPFTMSGATLVYERWFPPAFTVLAAVAAPRALSARAARIPFALVLAVPLATLLVSWPSFADSNRQYAALERLVPDIRPGSAIAVVNFGGHDGASDLPADRNFSLGCGGGRVLSERGGRLNYSFTDSPISPVVMPRRYQWQESLTRMLWDTSMFRPAHDLRRYRYVLVHSGRIGMAELIDRALSDQATHLGSAGEWSLFVSKQPVVPLLSPDAPMESPPPEALRDEIGDILRSLRASSHLPSSAPPDAPASSARPTPR